MTFEEYCKHREDKTFTAGQVIQLLEQHGYHYKLINTLVAPGQCTWVDSGMEEADAKAKIFEMYEGEIPFHFAYIKFYERDGQRFALVAGKTNLSSPDFQFTKKIKAITDSGDQAKRHLGKQYHWYCQAVLAVWEAGQELWEGPEDIANRNHGPQSKRAKAIERKIQELLGLFSS